MSPTPASPALGEETRLLIEQALRDLSDHMHEVTRAQAAGLDVSDQRERNVAARRRLETIYRTYYPQGGGIQ